MGPIELSVLGLWAHLPPATGSPCPTALAKGMVLLLTLLWAVPASRR